MYKFTLLTILFMITLSFGKEATESPVLPLHPDSLHFYVEPLSVDTFPSNVLTIQRDGRPAQKSHVSGYDIRRARGWRAGGITMICVGATGIAVPGSIMTIMTFVYEPFFIFPASATLAAGTGMIIGGTKMIRKGNSIDGVRVGIAPVVDPWNERYGAQFSLSF